MNRENDELVSSWVGSPQEENVSEFLPLKTVPAAVFQIVLALSLLIMSFVVPWKCSELDICSSKGSSIVVYMQAIFWAVIVIADAYVRLQHYFNRISGYLEFEIKTKYTRRAPFYVSSVFNLLLLVISNLFKDFCPEDKCAAHLALSPVNYVQIVVVFQVVVILPFIVHYLVHVWRFNQAHDVPDAFQDDLTSSRNQLNTSTSQDIGFRNESRLEELLERQSELIRHLKNHNAKLAKRIMTLTSQREMTL